MNVVTIVTTPNIGRTVKVIAPTSWPPLPIINDISPLDADTASPVLNAVVTSIFDFMVSVTITIISFETKEVNISTIAGTIKNGMRDISISAPIDMKNKAENTSLNGIVTTLATAALFDSATNTPAKKAPMTTDRPNILAANANPNAKPRITIRSNS